MSSHNTKHQIPGAHCETVDPGTGNPIVVDRFNQYIPLVIAASASETNTLPAPVGAGYKLTLMAYSVGASGSRTITVASAINSNGDTSIVFDAIDELIVLESVRAAADTYEWRVTRNENVASVTEDIAALDVTTLKIGGTAVGATAAELNAAADVSARLVSITDADTPLLVANSGKPHVIANVSADRTFTLPTPASGLQFEFFPGLNAADGHDWIFTSGSNTNYFTGGVQHLDTDAQDSADEIALVAPNGSSNSKLQINLPQPGTRLLFLCDGTLWNVNGIVASTTAPAFADQ